VLPPERVPEADHAVRQCLGLAAEGFDVHLLTRKQQYSTLPSSITVHAEMPDWSWAALPQIVRQIRRLDPDVVFLYFLGTLFDYSTMVLFLPTITRLVGSKVRFVTQFSNVGDGAPKDGTLRSAVKRAAFKALGPLRLGTLLLGSNGIVLLSQSAIEKLRRYYLPRFIERRCVVIPPAAILRVAADPEAARSGARRRLGLQDNDFVVAFFGRLASGKGIEALVQAVALLRERMPELRCLLVGGFLSTTHFWNAGARFGEELSALIQRNGLDGIVSITGEYDWDSTEASEYLFASDLAVLPLSSGVHLNNSSFAAVCTHRLPAVVTEGAYPEPALRHDVNSYKISSANPEEIAATIMTLRSDQQLRERLARGAEELALTHFDERRVTARLVDVITSRVA